MKTEYLDTILLLERLHRRFLDVVKVELDRHHIDDINNVQTLILYNIGDEELTVGELTNRGYYLGSNVSYNVKKLVENDYLLQERSPHDKRSVRVKLSDKGLKICEKMDGLLDEHTKILTELGAGDKFTEVNSFLNRLERFWEDRMRRF